MNIIQITFDALGKSTVTIGKNIQQGDHLTNKIRVAFHANHEPIATVRLHAKRPNGTVTPVLTFFESALQDDIWEYTLPSWFTEFAGQLLISVSVQFAGVVDGYETADIVAYPDYAALEADAPTDETKAYVTLSNAKVYTYDSGTEEYIESEDLSYEIPKQYQREVALFIEKSVVSSGTHNIPPTTESTIINLLTSLAGRVTITENDIQEITQGADVIRSTKELPSNLNTGNYDGYWYLIHNDSTSGKLYYIDGGVAYEVQLGVSELRLTVPSITGKTADTGKISFDTTRGTPIAGLLNDQLLHIGQTTKAYIKAAATITKGDVVQVFSTDGTHLLIKPAVPSDINSNPHIILGVAEETINNDAKGYIVFQGLIENVETRGVTQSQYFWYDSGSAQNGQWTINKPAAEKGQVLIGFIQKQETETGDGDGTIYVNPIRYPKISSLQDVEIITPTTGQVLRYNAITGKWINEVDQRIVTSETTPTDQYDGDLWFQVSTE